MAGVNPIIEQLVYHLYDFSPEVIAVLEHVRT